MISFLESTSSGATSQSITMDTHKLRETTTNAQMEAIPTLEQNAPLPFTSTSTAFRTELTSHFACEPFSRSVAKIQARRGSLIKAKHDFANNTSIIAQLEDLTSLAQAEFFLAENALEFQKNRHSDFSKQKELVLGDYLRSNYNLQDEFFERLGQKMTALPTPWMDTLHGDHDDNLDSSFWCRLDTQIDLMGLATTKRKLRIQKSLFDSMVSHQIATVQSLRLETVQRGVEESCREVVREECRGCSEFCGDEGCYNQEDVMEKLPEFLDGLDETHSTFIKKMADIRQQLRDAYLKIGDFRKYTIVFKVLVRQCTSDLKFSKDLALFYSPFRIFDLPREIRDAIYGQLLSFPYNVSGMQLAQNRKVEYRGRRWAHIGPEFWEESSCAWRGGRAVVWSHPLFHTSQQFRREAAEQFYERNSFASISMAIFSSQIPSLHFAHLITTLSLTWLSLGSLSVRTLKSLKLLKDLRFLTVYVEWQRLTYEDETVLGGIAATLGGIAALEYAVENLTSEMRSIEQLNVIEIQPNRKEAAILEEIKVLYRPPMSQYGPCGSSEQCEEDYDRQLSSRILNPQSAMTVYSNGRLPLKPSAHWKLSKEEIAYQDLNRARARVEVFVPAVELSKKVAIMARLAEIRKSVIIQRSNVIEEVTDTRREGAEYAACIANEEQQSEMQDKLHQIALSAAAAARRMHGRVMRDKEARIKALADAQLVNADGDEEAVRVDPGQIANGGNNMTMDAPELVAFWGSCDGHFPEDTV